jgi:hypothetical protein
MYSWTGSIYQIILRQRLILELLNNINNTKHRDASNNYVKKLHQESSEVHELKKNKKFQICQFCRHNTHDFRKCESRMICGVDNCTRNHDRLLHKDIRPPAVTLNIENAAPPIKVTLKMLPIRLHERSLTMAETLHYWILPLL